MMILPTMWQTKRHNFILWCHTSPTMPLSILCHTSLTQHPLRLIININKFRIMLLRLIWLLLDEPSNNLFMVISWGKLPLGHILEPYHRIHDAQLQEIMEQSLPPFRISIRVSKTGHFTITHIYTMCIVIVFFRHLRNFLHKCLIPIICSLDLHPQRSMSSRDQKHRFYIVEVHSIQIRHNLRFKINEISDLRTMIRWKLGDSIGS